MVILLGAVFNIQCNKNLIQHTESTTITFHPQIQFRNRITQVENYYTTFLETVQLSSTSLDELHVTKQQQTLTRLASMGDMSSKNISSCTIEDWTLPFFLSFFFPSFFFFFSTKVFFFSLSLLSFFSFFSFWRLFSFLDWRRANHDHFRHLCVTPKHINIRITYLLICQHSRN